MMLGKVQNVILGDLLLLIGASRKGTDLSQNPKGRKLEKFS